MRSKDGARPAKTLPFPVDSTTPVVILKLYHYLGLGVARSLGRLGVHVHGIDPNPDAHALSSRYCPGRYVKDLQQMCPDEAVEYLLTLGRKIGRKAVLFHTADESAGFVAEHAQQLSECYLLPCQSPELVRTVTSKRQMYLMVKRLGIPTAETWF